MEERLIYFVNVIKIKNKKLIIGRNHIIIFKKKHSSKRNISNNLIHFSYYSKNKVYFFYLYRFHTS